MDFFVQRAHLITSFSPTKLLRDEHALYKLNPWEFRSRDEKSYLIQQQSEKAKIVVFIKYSIKNTPNLQNTYHMWTIYYNKTISQIIIFFLANKKDMTKLSRFADECFSL